MIKCLYCNKSQANEMFFIEGYCWDCLILAHNATGLPIEVFISLIKEGAVIR